MNENIDLTKILKDCPKGWEFYSSVYGEVRFVEITPTNPVSCKSREDEWFGQEVLEHKYPVKFMAGICEYSVSKAGKLKDGVGECTFFPSREQRDWSKFTAPWYKKEKLVELKENDDEKMRNFIINELVCLRATDEKGSDRYEGLTNAITWLEKQEEQNLLSTNERAWLYLISDVLTWKDGIGQYLDDSNVQELAKKLCNKYAQKLYNPSVFSNSSNNGR